MDTIQYPLYLKGADLPLLQPLVNQAVWLATPLWRVMSTQVAEYVTNAKKVDTLLMIDFFRNRLPPQWAEVCLMAKPELRDCLQENSPVPLPENAVRMTNSPERKLLAWAYIFFGYNNFQFRLTLTPEERERVVENLEYLDFFDRVVGISIIERTNAALEKVVCHGYVFNQYPWYSRIDPTTTLLNDTKTVINYLKSKGFTVTKKPAVGQIVVYHTNETVKHYGRVEFVSSSREVTVVSKFSDGHIFRHRAALVDILFGTSMTFVIPPEGALR